MRPPLALLGRTTTHSPASRARVRRSPLGARPENALLATLLTLLAGSIIRPASADVSLSATAASHVYGVGGAIQQCAPAAAGTPCAEEACAGGAGGGWETQAVGCADDFGVLRAMASATSSGTSSCYGDATAVFKDEIVVVGLAGTLEVFFDFDIVGETLGPVQSCAAGNLDQSTHQRACVSVSITGALEPSTQSINLSEIVNGVARVGPFQLTPGVLYPVTVTLAVRAISGAGASSSVDFHSAGRGVVLRPLVVESGGETVPLARARGASCHQYLGPPLPADGVLRVSPNGTVEGSGANWANAVQSLQHALLLAKLPCGVHSIWVERGTYLPGTSRHSSFLLAREVSVYGGFAGTERSLEERDVAANPTVLSGDLNGDDQPNFGSRGDNAYHVVRAQNIGCCCTLDGFTIRGGQADAPDGLDRRGGGVHAQQSAITIRNCRFTDNLSRWEGGGFLSLSSTALLENCVFDGNRSGAPGASGYGAGASFLDSIATVRASAFSANLSTYGGGAVGGGGSTSLSIENCLFEDNVASLSGNGGAGGAIYTACPTTCAGSEFIDNRAWQGGAIYTAAVLTLSNCLFTGNAADLGDAGWAQAGFGGAVATAKTPLASVAIDECAFLSNSAKSSGGALWIEGTAGLNTVVGCSFQGNSTTTCAGDAPWSLPGGGAVRATSSTLLERCDFVENHSPISGGAVSGPVAIRTCRFEGNHLVNLCGLQDGNQVLLVGGELSNSLLIGGSGGTSACAAISAASINNSTIAGNTSPALLAAPGVALTVRNSIIWGNASLWAGGGTPSPLLTVVSSNLQGLLAPGAGNMSVDPLFAGTCDEPYALLDRSACIDTGSNIQVPAWMTTDLAGGARIAGRPPVVDMGAFEWTSAMCSPADLNNDGIIDGADLGLLLSAWGRCPACPADFNGDGMVDGEELGVLLAAWTS